MDEKDVEYILEYYDNPLTVMYYVNSYVRQSFVINKSTTAQMFVPNDKAYVISWDVKIHDYVVDACLLDHLFYWLELWTK